MKVLIRSIIMAAMLIGVESYAQNNECAYPDATKISPLINFKLIPNESEIIYSYEIRNLNDGEQGVWIFMLDHDTADIESLAPDNWSARNVANKNTVSWGANGFDYFIYPSDSLAGFIVASKTGLPAFFNYYAEGYVNPPYFPEGQVPEHCEGESIYENNIKGVTIAPKDPPPELVPEEFVNTIISYKHEAETLGWITGKGILHSLDVKLDNARKKLAQGNTKAAVNILGAFVHEVEAQGCASYEDCPPGKHIKPEAWALLKFNAEYLIRELSK